MKRSFNFILVSCMTLLLTGCYGDWDYVFNSSDKNIYAPLDINDGENVNLMQYPHIDNLVISTLAANGLILGFSSDDLIDGAMIINDRSQLKDYVDEDHNYVWPEIDFNKYSLVIGGVFLAHSGFELEQRIVKKGNVPELYVRLVELNYGLQYISTRYFASLYPKIGYEGEIKVNVQRAD